MAQANGVGDAVFSTVSANAQAGLSDRVRPSRYVCGAIVVAGAMALFASASVIKVNVWQARLALTLGGLSYPLYLLHNSFGSALVNWLPAPTVLALAIGFGVVMAICLAVWKLEVPLRRRLSLAARTRRQSFLRPT
jgi:peptidoglycan/LPS O-acetylase OafA/YrhL